MRKTVALYLIFLTANVFAQDPEFSQYYAAPLYLNPAFTGTTNDHRFIANYRNQWPSVAQGYTTTAFSYDYNLHDLNSGFGFAAQHINQPNRSLVNQYAYVPMKVTIHGGVRIPLYTGVKKARIPVLSPSFVYKRQANFEQFDVGAYLLYDPLIFGLWYRGIP